MEADLDDQGLSLPSSHDISWFWNPIVFQKTHLKKAAFDHVKDRLPMARVFADPWWWAHKFKADKALAILPWSSSSIHWWPGYHVSPLFGLLEQPLLYAFLLEPAATLLEQAAAAVEERPWQAFAAWRKTALQALTRGQLRPVKLGCLGQAALWMSRPLRRATDGRREAALLCPLLKLRRQPHSPAGMTALWRLRRSLSLFCLTEEGFLIENLFLAFDWKCHAAIICLSFKCRLGKSGRHISPSQWECNHLSKRNSKHGLWSKGQ